MSRYRRGGGLALVSFIIGLALTMVPLPDNVELLRPYWLAMLLIYWCLELPEKIGMGAAFVAGIAMDLATGTLLGEHALSLVIVAFLVRRFRLRLRFFPMWQLTLVVLALLMNDRVVTLWINGLRGAEAPSWEFWIAPLIGAFLWPWIYLILDRARQRSATA